VTGAMFDPIAIRLLFTTEPRRCAPLTPHDLAEVGRKLKEARCS
jgi:hypothetical protein